MTLERDLGEAIALLQSDTDDIELETQLIVFIERHGAQFVEVLNHRVRGLAIVMHLNQIADIGEVTETQWLAYERKRNEFCAKLGSALDAFKGPPEQRRGIFAKVFRSVFGFEMSLVMTGIERAEYFADLKKERP